MKRSLSFLFPCIFSIWMAGCGTGGSGPAPTPTPPGPPSTAASPAPIAGVAFLPQSFSSSYQYRTSLSRSGNSLYFSDSSSSPLKTLSLTDFSITSLARKVSAPESVTVQGAYAYWVDEDRLNQTALSGTTTVLATGTRTPAAGATADIVVDNTHAYWVNAAGSIWTIQKVPLAGGATTTLATASRQIVTLKGDANNIYWEENSPEPVTTGCGCGSAIRSVPKAGGTPVTLVDGTLNGLLPPPPVGQIGGSWIATGGLAVNGSTIYFGRSGSASYSIMSIAAAGGAITTLATPGTPMSAATGSVLNVHSDGVNVYWIDAGNATLDSVAVAGGTPTILASGLQSPSALAINATNAYWAERGAAGGCCLQMAAGVIKAVPLGGGTVSTVMSNLDAPTALALDAGNIYWNEIWRMASAPLAGGAATTLASGISSAMPRIAVDTVNAYILDGDLIKMVPLAGGTVQKLSPAHGGNIGDLSVINQDIATDGTNVYWSVISGTASPAIRSVPVGGGTAVTLSNPGTIVSPQDCYWRIALDAANVYWSAGSASQAIGCTINKVPKAGGATTVLADVPYMRDFTVDGTDVYFSAFNNFGSISRISVNGGPATILASGTTLTTWVLANDNLNVYWIDPTQALPAGIGKMPKSGGGTSFLVEKVLATDTLLAADALAVDQSGIYWSENVGGRIYTPIVASTSSFPLLNATKALAASGESLTFTVSGSCTGSGSASSTAATTSSVFEGVAGFSSTVTSTVSLTNCTPATSTSSEIDYYDANYIPLGYDATASGGSYALFLTPPTVPASVVIGNSGAIGTRALYTNSGKAVASGSEVLSYSVEPDTATSAIVNVTTKTYDAAGALTLTSQVRYRITTTGSLKRLSEDHQDVATHLVLTFN